MATLRTITTGPSRGRVAQAAAAVAVALLLGGAAARPVAAEGQQAIDAAVASYEQECSLEGGTPRVNWTFDENGDVTQVLIACDKETDDQGYGPWQACLDGQGERIPEVLCDGYEPPLTTPPGPVIAPPALPSQNANQSATAPTGPVGSTPPSDRPVTLPLTSGDQGNGGNGDAALPTNGDGGGTTGPSDPMPPSDGTLPGTGHAPKPHKGHKHHGHQSGQATPLAGKAAKTAHPAKAKAAQAAAHHAKAKAKVAQHGKHGAK